MYYEPKWEQVVDSTYRMKTPGGWLVYDSVDAFDGKGNYNPQSCAFCYVPDPGHDWDFEPEEKPKDE